VICLLSLGALALAGPVEARLAFGGQIQASGNGITDLGIRTDHLSAVLYTDTLALHWRQERSGGRAWIGLRGAAFAAGFFFNPWTAGAPDPGRALRSSYLGPEVGVQRYLDRGLWIGAEGHARYTTFGALDGTVVGVPDPALWIRADATAGLWQQDGALQARLRIGLDVEPLPYGAQTLSPHLFFDGSWRPRWPVAPWLGLHVGWAEEQDALTQTRIGGLTPYEVPLAGAAWFEFWAEDYAVGRVGIVSQGERGWAGVTLDGGTVGGGVWGLAAHGGWTRGSWQLEGALGWAGGVPRQPGVSPLSVYLMLERPWAPPRLQRDGP